MTRDPVYANMHVNLRSTSRDHQTDDSSHPSRKKRFLVSLCVLLLVMAITTGVLYAQVSIRFARLQLQQCSNATMDIKALTSELEETAKMLTEQKEENANLSKELQGLRKCANNLDYFNGSCYYFSSDEKNWTDSRDACVAMGGHLAIIDSQQEMTFLIQRGENHWIGLNQPQPNGNWSWVDKKPLTSPRFWGPHQPDDAGQEDCVQINLKKWNDAACHRSLKRICEL